MRILHLDSGREMRGGQWQALRLHRGLIARGHHSLLLAREGFPLLETAHKEQLPAEPLRIAALLRPFDIVHVHDARSHTLGALFARNRLVVSRRVAFPVRESLLSRWKYRRAALFIAVSHFVASQLAAAGIDRGRIVVVYDGVPLPSQAACGNAILAPATNDPMKGAELAREAARLAGVEIQFSDNLDRDLPHARALLYLTQSEGLGSAVLLGMAHGVTVIASRTGGILELIENGSNGVLVENNPEAVASALQNIDPVLGQRARATFAARFTEERMIESTLDAYRRALGDA